MAPPLKIVIEAVDKASAVIASVGKGVEGLGKAALNIDWSSTVDTISDVARAIYELGETGSQFQRIESSFKMLATTAGTSADYMLEKLREASQGAINDADLMLTANKAMMLGVTANADQMARLLEIAALRGRAMGISTTQAFEDIAKGIGRASSLILDNLGIIVDSKKNYETYAAAIGKTATQLTKAEKAQALLTSVLSEGNRMLEDAGGLAEDNALSYEQLRASWTNLTNAIAVKAADVAGGVGNIASVIEFATRLVKEFEVEWKNLIPIYGAFLTLQDGVNAVISVGTDTIEKNKGVTVDWSNAYMELARSLAGVDTATRQYTPTLEEQEEAERAAADAARDLSRALSEKLDFIGKITDETQDYKDKQGELNAKLQEATDKLQLLRDQGYGETSKKILEVKEQIGELNGELDANAAAFEMNARRSILAMLEKELAIDGLNKTEYNYLLEIGKQWGIYSSEAVAAAQAAWEKVMLLKAGIESVPNQVTIEFILLQTGELPTPGTPVGGGQGGSGKPEMRAEGGAVYAGTPYIIGEYGKELFVPKQDGQIIPNGRFGMGGGNVTINYAPTISTASMYEVREVLEPVIRDAMRSARMGAGA